MTDQATSARPPQSASSQQHTLMQSQDLIRALRGILITAAAGSTFGLGVGLFYDDRPALVVAGVSLAAIPLIWRLVATGHTMAAAIGLIGLFNALTVYALIFGGGVQDPTVMLFPVMIIASGVLLEKRFAIGASVVLVASCIGVGIAELAGVIETRLSFMLSISDVLFLAMLIVIVACMVQLLSRALRESVHRASMTHQSYQEIFNASGEGIIVHDADTGEIIDVNDSALSMLGYSHETRDELTPAALVAPRPPYDRSEFDGRIANVGLEGSSFDWCVSDRDGAPVWVEVTLRKGKVQGHDRIVAVFRDTSERRVLQEQVQTAEKLRAVGQLARGVAHDFNNQLTVILANASLLEAGIESSPDLREYTQAIIESSRRSADLTQQLLAFARKGQRRQERIDIDALVADVKALLARSIDKRIEVVHVESSAPAIIHGDTTFLQNALLNLGLNARDAMPDGGTLTMTVDTDPGDGNVIVRVQDTGVGMTEDVIGHIFEPFYTTRDEGNGMGLAAVYGTIADHDGTIDVESEPGRGTTFTLRIPAASEADQPDSPAKQEPITRRHSGVRVLLAEDEPGVARVAIRILESFGCEVHHYEDGESALRGLLADEPRFDAAILDHSMPGMTGAEVLQALRESGRGVPVIAISGYTEATDASPMHRAEAFVPKPFAREQLAEALDSVLVGHAAKAD